MPSRQSLWTASALVAAAGVAVIYFIPSPIDPDPVSLGDSLPRLEGPLSVNTHLQRLEKLFEGQIIGPESFAAGSDGEERYHNKYYFYVIGSYELEPECGRPKGMKVDSSGRLVVADAYNGILRIDVDSGETEVLVDRFNGSRFLFLNALDIASDGTIYFSDSSTKWERRDYRYEVIETNKLGRVLALSPQSKEVRIVQDGLYLPNGLSLSEDENFLLVAEMSVSRISRIYLKGPRANSVEVLTENLPGYPDNIKRNSRGNYYVGMGSVRFQGSSPIGSFLDLVGPYPPIKRFITKIVPASLFDVFLPKHAMLLEMDEEGNIVTSHHDPGALVVRAVSEAFEHSGKIYIGHFKIPYIGVIKKSIFVSE
ncbi:adipocyte plasma membrane-associated protein [Aplysia californica]|uniref:Adipocyte plasma membrane-associated protein n=1 Tax=Aplysia californica TaxID=6500 RepID=A0ABM1ABL8_APLCA|nr:adipocyte plasma membrane-associated protein [Aplysia californica]